MTGTDQTAGLSTLERRVYAAMRPDDVMTQVEIADLAGEADFDPSRVARSGVLATVELTVRHYFLVPPTLQEIAERFRIEEAYALKMASTDGDQKS